MILLSGYSVPMFGSAGGGFSAKVTSVCGPLPLSRVVNQAALTVVPESATAAICPAPVMPWSNSGAGPQTGPLPAQDAVRLPCSAAMPPALFVVVGTHGATLTTPSISVAASSRASRSAGCTAARTYGMASARSLRRVISTFGTRLRSAAAMFADETPAKALTMIS